MSLETILKNYFNKAVLIGALSLFSVGCETKIVYELKNYQDDSYTSSEISYNNYDALNNGSNNLDGFNNNNNNLCPKKYFEDKDADGFGAADSFFFVCEELFGYANNNLDCDDYDSNINPNAIEICDDKKDNNCDSIKDSIMITIQDSYIDNDGDGFGAKSLGSINICENQYYVTNNLDCNDNDKNVNPNAIEICDAIDNNCNNLVNENKISHASIGCYSNENSIYWKNSCGGLEDIIQKCKSNEQCIDDKCVCQPDCYQKSCGDDGCGGICGLCDAGYECKEIGIIESCVCIPDCGNKCCEVYDKKCYYNTILEDNFCVSKSADICNDEMSGFCPVGYTCFNNSSCPGSGSDFPSDFCCPEDKPFYTVGVWAGLIGYGKSHPNYCCDTCKIYPDNFFNSEEELDEHCAPFMKRKWWEN